jgi:hypothetical protein
MIFHLDPVNSRLSRKNANNKGTMNAIVSLIPCCVFGVIFVDIQSDRVIKMEFFPRISQNGSIFHSPRTQ